MLLLGAVQKGKARSPGKCKREGRGRWRSPTEVRNREGPWTMSALQLLLWLLLLLICATAATAAACGGKQDASSGAGTITRNPMEESLDHLVGTVDRKIRPLGPVCPKGARRKGSIR